MKQVKFAETPGKTVTKAVLRDEKILLAFSDCSVLKMIVFKAQHDESIYISDSDSLLDADLVDLGPMVRNENARNYDELAEAIKRLPTYIGTAGSHDELVNAVGQAERSLEYMASDSNELKALRMVSTIVYRSNDPAIAARLLDWVNKFDQYPEIKLVRRSQTVTEAVQDLLDRGKGDLARKVARGNPEAEKLL